MPFLVSQPVRSGRQSTESVESSSPTKAIGIGTRRQPIASAPFPGPGSSSSTECVDQVGESILSPANSVFSSQSSTASIFSGGEHDQDYKSHDMNPILEYEAPPFEVDVEITGCEEERDQDGGRRENGNGMHGGNANEHLSKTTVPVGKTRAKEVDEERVGSPQDVAKIEAFRNSLAYHFSTILLSEDAKEVVSSAQ